MTDNLSYDVIVIGGGSGGMASAQRLAKLGQTVAIVDYVAPSETKGTTWGFGGTCVNVGCIPKKLFHRAGAFGQAWSDGEMQAFGFGKTLITTDGIPPVDWSTVVTTVQNYVKSLNFMYRTAVRKNSHYYNGFAKFEENGGVHVQLKDGSVKKIYASKAIIVAVGGRPQIPENVIGAKEHSITSDDIFSLKENPKKTLVVGGSYIGLETASFLNGLGNETALLIRSQPLRSALFDADASEKLVSILADCGVKVLRNKQLLSIVKDGDDRLKISFDDSSSEVFDTVVFATGRKPNTMELGLPSSVAIDPSTLKIKVGAVSFLAAEATANTPAIYAIGDCALTVSPELTPVAIRQGEILASLITNENEFNGSSSNKRLKSLDMVPTSVFTLPSEYSVIGLSEVEAIKTYGEENVEIFLREWQPLEASAAHVKSKIGIDATPRAFCKLVSLKSENGKIVGLHLISPNSSEVIHGLALACSLGATKEDFDNRVLGIHPTDAEGLTDVTVTKASGVDYVINSGCGGGKCG